MLHKYWRLGVASTQGNDYFQITEVAFLDADGVDVSVGGVASASSEYGAGYEASKAFDKNLGTDYCNTIGQFPAWLQYECPAPEEVVAVRFRWAAQARWLPSSWEVVSIRSSPDGVNWDQQYNISVASGGIVSGTEAYVQLAEVIYVPPVAARVSTSVAVWSAPVGPLSMVLDSLANAVADLEFGGAGRVYGTTEVKGSPANAPRKARVRLVRDRDGLLVRETWSDPDTGAFAFTGLDTTQKFTALASDSLGEFRPIAADRLAPEVTP